MEAYEWKVNMKDGTLKYSARHDSDVFWCVHVCSLPVSLWISARSANYMQNNKETKQ